MTREERLRRVVLLCGHFTRNLAYYRAGWKDKKLLRNTEFWRAVNGNCFDLCILEWCKLLADRKGKHHWSAIVSDRAAFETAMLTDAGLTAEKLEAYRIEMLTYRNKFAAHLDSEKTMNLPYLDIAERTVYFYHGHVVHSEATADMLKGLPLDLGEYSRFCVNEAAAVYAS